MIIVKLITMKICPPCETTLTRNYYPNQLICDDHERKKTLYDEDDEGAKGEKEIEQNKNSYSFIFYFFLAFQ